MKKNIFVAVFVSFSFMLHGQTTISRALSGFEVVTTNQLSLF